MKKLIIFPLILILFSVFPRQSLAQNAVLSECLNNCSNNLNACLKGCEDGWKGVPNYKNNPGFQACEDQCHGFNSECVGRCSPAPTSTQTPAPTPTVISAQTSNPTSSSNTTSSCSSTSKSSCLADTNCVWGRISPLKPSCLKTSQFGLNGCPDGFSEYWIDNSTDFCDLVSAPTIAPTATPAPSNPPTPTSSLTRRLVWRFLASCTAPTTPPIASNPSPTPACTQSNPHAEGAAGNCNLVFSLGCNQCSLSSGSCSGLNCNGTCWDSQTINQTCQGRGATCSTAPSTTFVCISPSPTPQRSTPTPRPSTSTCSETNEGNSRCGANNTVVESCVRDSIRQLDWRLTASCTQLGKTCTQSTPTRADCIPTSGTTPRSTGSLACSGSETLGSNTATYTCRNSLGCPAGETPFSGRNCALDEICCVRSVALQISPTAAPRGTTPTPTSPPVSVILAMAINAQDVPLTDQSIDVNLSLFNLTTNSPVSGLGNKTFARSPIPGRQYAANISLTNLTPDKYFVIARRTDMIAKSVVSVSGSTGTITVPTTTLVFGDLNKDNEINVLDHENEFKKCWKKPATGSCVSSDFDKNDKIDVIDYNIFLRGFATWRKQGQGL